MTCNIVIFIIIVITFLLREPITLTAYHFILLLTEMVRAVALVTAAILLLGCCLALMLAEKAASEVARASDCEDSEEVLTRGAVAVVDVVAEVDVAVGLPLVNEFETKRMDNMLGETMGDIAGVGASDGSCMGIRQLLTFPWGSLISRQ